MYHERNHRLFVVLLHLKVVYLSEFCLVFFLSEKEKKRKEEKQPKSKKEMKREKNGRLFS